MGVSCGSNTLKCWAAAEFQEAAPLARPCPEFRPAGGAVVFSETPRVSDAFASGRHRARKAAGVHLA